ncbi:MAG: hypothetical protein E7350_04960 [Clostridiales bacterium]|nr:hypothetical protein [Clostridiales bacterium]
MDETSPKTRTVIITDEEAFNEIFKEGDLDVDYNKQMVILHIFASGEPTFRYKITKVKLDKKQVLKIYYKLKFNFGKAGGAMPGQKCFLVKMKKTDVTAVELVEER